MALNIKNEETQRLSRELAEQTGESLTTAVTVADQERLDRLRARVDTPAQRAGRMALGRQIAAVLPPDGMYVEDLYDEAGLPV